MQELVNHVREKLSLTKPQSFLPLEFTPGSTAQVDHGEVDCIIEEERRTSFLFVMAIPGTGLRYCQLFATKAQEAWGEFHERAFRFFDGIFPRLIYDNDTVLVKSLKEKRLMTDFAVHLVEHYGFETQPCLQIHNQAEHRGRQREFRHRRFESRGTGCQLCRTESRFQSPCRLELQNRS